MKTKKNSEERIFYRCYKRLYIDIIKISINKMQIQHDFFILAMNFIKEKGNKQ